MSWFDSNSSKEISGLAGVATLLIFGKDIAVGIYRLALTPNGIALIASGSALLALSTFVAVVLVLGRK